MSLVEFCLMYPAYVRRVVKSLWVECCQLCWLMLHGHTGIRYTTESDSTQPRKCEEGMKVEAIISLFIKTRIHLAWLVFSAMTIFFFLPSSTFFTEPFFPSFHYVPLGEIKKERIAKKDDFFWWGEKNYFFSVHNPFCHKIERRIFCVAKLQQSTLQQKHVEIASYKEAKRTKILTPKRFFWGITSRFDRSYAENLPPFFPPKKIWSFEGHYFSQCDPTLLPAIDILLYLLSNDHASHETPKENPPTKKREEK